MTDAVGSIKEINDNFPAFRFVNYLVPVGIFTEATVCHQNIEGGTGFIKLTSEKGYLSYHFREEFDFHLAKDPYAGEWKSENLISPAPKAEQTFLESSPVKKESESERQTVGQDPDLVVDFSATQQNSCQIPNVGQGIILGPESKRLEKEKRPSIFSSDELPLFDNYRLNQCILNFPELVFTLESVLEQKRNRLKRVQGNKTQQASLQQDETTQKNLSRQDKTIRALESEIQELEAQKLKKDKLDDKITHLQGRIATLEALESFANEKIQKLETKKLNTEALNEEIADLQKKIRSRKQKSLEHSKSFAKKKRYNLEKQKSELENSKQKLEREALGKERCMAEQRLILLEEYLKEKYFERIAQAKEQPMEGDHLTNEQLKLFTTLVKEGQSKVFYLRLALAASILLAVTGSVAVYYVSLSVFSTLAFFGTTHSIAALPYNCTCLSYGNRYSISCL
ncbi:coiled-coil domain-containing protein [Rickettsiella massiliensis]|uniref:hypothetical protein n=1 Tax=Rickettsiella massiliensis TaxID=676517 RepID=UPI0012EA2007|nr:hypothetical protein [Rickettsiella massiliensis]